MTSREASPGQPGPERLEWLRAARQQSQALAELRAAHPAPFVWGRRAGARLGWRPLWVTAGLAAGVLGLATVTLATLHHRTEAPRPSPRVVPMGAVPPVAAPKAPAARPIVAPAVEPAKPAAPVLRRRARPVARRVVPGKARAAAQTPSDQSPPHQVNLEGDEPGSMIIVTPPRKMDPLWTPESYRKQRAGRQRW